jgi:hypothetical protein
LNIISNPPGSVNRCRVRCGAPTPSTLLQFGSLPLRISTTPCSCPWPAVTCGGPPTASTVVRRRRSSPSHGLQKQQPDQGRCFLEPSQQQSGHGPPALRTPVHGGP